MEYLDVIKNFNIDKYGTIKTPGKFKGLYYGTPYFYELAISGKADLEVYWLGKTYYFFILTPEDKEFFSDIKRLYGIMIFETEYGSIGEQFFESQKEMENFISLLEKRGGEIL